MVEVQAVAVMPLRNGEQKYTLQYFCRFLYVFLYHLAIFFKDANALFNMKYATMKASFDLENFKTHPRVI